MEKSFPRTRRYFRDYTTHSSFHGCTYIGEGRRTYFERGLWIVILVMALGGALYLIKGIYSKWKDNPVIVSYDTRETLVSDIPFPSVTVCPEAKSRQSVYSHSKNLKKILDGDFLNTNELKHSLYMSLLCDVNVIQYINTSNMNFNFSDEQNDLYQMSEYFVPKDFYTFIYNASIDFFISNCQWLGQKVSCKDLFFPIITDEGVCYTFNMFDLATIYQDSIKYSSDVIPRTHRSAHNSVWNLIDGYSQIPDVHPFPKRALFAGAKSALSFELVTRKEDIDYVCKNGNVGFRMCLHSPLVIPTPGQYYFSIPLDSKSVIGAVHPRVITTSQLVNLYSPSRRGCYLENEKKLDYFKIYSQMHCYMQCLNEYVLELHNCTLFFNPRKDHICGALLKSRLAMDESSLKTLHLRGTINNTFSAKPSSSTIKQAENSMKGPNCDCLPSCSELEYDVETSYYDWQWQKMKNMFGTTSENSSYHKKIYKSQVLLYFKTPHFVSSKRHELYGPSDFIANFGGLLGLFTGFSLLTVIEIIYFATIRICCNIRLYGKWSGKDDNLYDVENPHSS